jgi:hypothetical protein
MFTATLTGELVDLRSIDMPETMKLHQDRLMPWQCRGCGGRVHMRTHRDEAEQIVMVTFAHHPGEAERCRELGFHTDESPAHHQLKDRLAGTAKRAGWDVDLEVPGDRCRADVVVSRRGQTRVLEAQLSPLGERDVLDRTDRYQRSFGQTTWTHTKPRPWSRKVESLRVADDLSTIIDGVYLDQAGNRKAEPAPIATTLPDILNGRLRYVFFDTSEGTIGYFTPIGAPRGEVQTRKRQRQKIRGVYVSECSRPLKRTLTCTNCGLETQAGRPCENPNCKPKGCPGCGRLPWHDKAVCPDCGARAQEVG